MIRARRGIRAVAAVAVVAAIAAFAVHSATPTNADASSNCNAGWVAAWHASPVADDGRDGGDALPELSGRTVRMTVRPAAAGTAVRLHFTNRYGTTPLRIGRVAIGTRPVTFLRRHAATIRPGGSLTSDALTTPIAANLPVAVSVFVVDAATPVTRHVDTRTTSYVTDASGASTPTASAFYFDGLDVLAPVRTNAVIAVGDSITDGFGTTLDAHAKWTEALQRRLDRGRADERMVVLNGGIAGNRLLIDDPNHHGDSALSRLRWDAAANRGVTDVILSAGTNDIGFGNVQNASTVTAGMTRFATHAHRLGLRVFATTITPTVYGRWGDDGANQLRDSVNEWIRRVGPKVFDGVFDFAAAVADPTRHVALAAAYDAGDGLHVSDAGQERLARAVNVDTLTGSPCLATR